MTASYQQTNSTAGGGISSVIMAVGGAAGTRSASVTANSAGGGVHQFALFATAVADPGTPSCDPGVVIHRWNITTANTNLTWSRYDWLSSCQGISEQLKTATVTLAISLGTTGVKTASCEATNSQNLAHACGTESARALLRLYGSSVATMVGVFVFVPDQITTMPFTAGSGTPAVVTAMGVLAQTKAGI